MRIFYIMFTGPPSESCWGESERERKRKLFEIIFHGGNKVENIYCSPDLGLGCAKIKKNFIEIKTCGANKTISKSFLSERQQKRFVTIFLLMRNLLARQCTGWRNVVLEGKIVKMIVIVWELSCCVNEQRLYES